MFVVFLDIDNVLNAQFTRERLDNIVFVMDSKIKLLKQLIDRFEGAKVVLSSSWRKGWAEEDAGLYTRNVYHFHALRDKLLEHGIELMSYTPILNGSINRRGEEISMWLESWQGEPIESYVVLDDLNGRYLRPHAGRLVRTSIAKGLLPKHVELAVKILEKPLEKSKSSEGTLEEEVLFWWTRDGVPIVCDKTDVTLTEEEHCYACARTLSEGEAAVQLFAVEEDSEFVLCPECAAKSCEKA